MPVRGNIECTRRGYKLQQVKARQVARRVVQKHVFTARIRCVDPRRVLARVPPVDRRIELHPRIAAKPCGLRDLGHDLPRPVGLHRLVPLHREGRKLAVVLIRPHEFVAHPHRVVRVLEENRRIRLRVRPAPVVSRLDQRERFRLFLRLAVDEVHDVRVIHIQDHHLRRPPRLAPALDDPRKRVKPAHEAQRPRCLPAARKLFHRSADR